MDRMTRLDNEGAIAAPYPRSSPFSNTARQLLSQGYSPLPLIGKRPIEAGWQRRARAPTSLEQIAYSATRINYNVGIAMGYRGVVAIDIDTDVPEIRAALDAALHAALSRGGVLVGKRGRRGDTRFFRDPTGDIGNRNLSGADGAMIVEILATGRQTVVPPSVHPDSADKYEWTAPRTLLDTAPEELPILLRSDVEAIERALLPWLRCPMPALTKVSKRSSKVALDAVERARQHRYAIAVLERETRALAALAQHTGRNRRAFDIACRLGRWVHNGIISEDRVCGAILAACEQNGLVREDGQRSVIASIRSGLARAVNDELPLLGTTARGSPSQ